MILKTKKVLHENCAVKSFLILIFNTKNASSSGHPGPYYLSYLKISDNLSQSSVSNNGTNEINWQPKISNNISLNILLLLPSIVSVLGQEENMR